MEGDSPESKRSKRNSTSSEFESKVDSSMDVVTTSKPNAEKVGEPQSKRSKRNSTSPEAETTNSNDVSAKSSSNNEQNIKRKTAKRPSSSPVPSSSTSTADAPTPPAPKNLMDLNDTCLLDLCDYAEASVRSKELAREVFVTKHRDVALSSLIDPATGRYTLATAEKLLRIFGDQIRSLTLDESDLADARDYGNLLGIIAEHCMSTIEKVEFLNVDGTDFGVGIATRLFGTQLMMRNAEGPGIYRSQTKLICTPQSVVTEQVMVRDVADADDAE